jgi:PEP-CTERM motif
MLYKALQLRTDSTFSKSTAFTRPAINYDLLLNDGIGQTFTLDPGNSTVTLTGTATTATANLLQFNYDTPPSTDVGNLGSFEILDSTAGWGLAFAVPPNQVLGGIINPDGAGTVGLLYFGSQPIMIGTATPEPSTLVISGLCLLGVMWRRRRMSMAREADRTLA